MTPFGSLAPGMRIGKYEVLELIGSGGMGEVWKARDTLLHRDVALKTVAESNRLDPEALARVEREALLLASLNHPNIATLHGLETVGEAHVLVMELVDGETLEDRIARAPRGRGLALGDALDVAAQIAAALDDAHQHGVVHRDLKPANVKIRKDGTVKVLDFGIAKALSGQGAGAAARTVTTQADAVIGTASYMSPEQAEGGTVDRKTDVWAFGCVLYEMLTGQRAFDGDSHSRILARVIEREPDWKLLAKDVPERIRRLLMQCLEKDPRKRRRDVGDIRLDIEQSRSEPLADAQAVTRSGSRTILPWVAAAAILAAVLTWLLRPPPEAVPGGAKRTWIPLPRSQVLTQLAVRGIAISRDGMKAAYVANNEIYLYDMNEGTAHLLPGTHGMDVSTPVFSPDGEHLVFYEMPTSSVLDAVLKRVPVAGGGTPLPLWEGPAPLSVSWPTDDALVFVTIPCEAIPTCGSILQIPAEGGDGEVLLEARDGETLESPQLLPDGRLLFTSRPAGTSWDDATIYIKAIDSDERTRVRTGGSDARWVQTGYIVYANGNRLLAGRWDLERPEGMEDFFTVVSGVQRGINSDAAQYDLSDDGTLVYVPGHSAPPGARRSSLVLVESNRPPRTLPIESDEFRMVRISPDQRRAAAVVGVPGDIWVYNLETGTGRRLTADEGDETYPLWVNDRELWFFSSRADRPGIYSIPAEGGETTLVAAGSLTPESLTPDGNVLLASSPTSDAQSDIAVLDLLASPPEPGVPIAGNPSIADPAFAQNGQWVAAAVGSPVGGSSQLGLIPFPVAGRAWVTVGRSQSVRRHTVFVDDQLLFHIKDQGIYSVDVSFDESEPVIGQDVQPLVTRPYWYGVNGPDGSGGRAWDVFADGTLLLIGVGEENEAATDQIAVVANWFDVLERSLAGP